MLNEQSYYRIRKPVIESLMKNESDAWVAGQAALNDMVVASKQANPVKGPAVARLRPMFSDDERDRIVALKILKDVGVYKSEYERPIGPQLSELITEVVH